MFVSDQERHQGQSTVTQPNGSIRAYKYKHSTTSARSTRPCLVLYDHRSKHQSEVVPHDQCGLTPLKAQRSSRTYTAESSLEKTQGFPELMQKQSTANPNTFLNRRDIRSNGRIMTEYSGNYSESILIDRNVSTIRMIRLLKP